MYEVTSKYHLLIDCAAEYFDVPDVIICGACVQIGWCKNIAYVIKLFFGVVIGDGESSIFISGPHLI